LKKLLGKTPTTCENNTKMGLKGKSGRFNKIAGGCGPLARR
jgi:hypothetical protein